MKALLYKEFKLIVNPLFYLVPLFSALLLIPEWVFFLTMIYFCSTSVPNIFNLSKTYKEVYFSATQPVTRRDIVKARVLSLVVLEILQMIVAAVCVVIRLNFMATPNFFIDPNVAFLGFSFVMFGVFNAVMLPLFYKTAYKIAMPAILANVAAILFAAGVELALIYLPFFRFVDGMNTTPAHVATLAAGLAIFAVLNYLAYRLSAAWFEKIDL